MRLRYFVLIVTVLLISNCDLKPQENNSDQVYISQRQPFEIPAAEKSIQIPDSLRPNDFYEGMMVINYFVDAEGNTEGINLRLLRIKDEYGNKLIWYYNESMEPVDQSYYPPNIQHYLNWVFAYARTREIKRIEEVDNDLKWMMSVMVRLK